MCLLWSSQAKLPLGSCSCLGSGHQLCMLRGCLQSIYANETHEHLASSKVAKVKVMVVDATSENEWYEWGRPLTFVDGEYLMKRLWDKMESCHMHLHRSLKWALWTRLWCRIEHLNFTIICIANKPNIMLDRVHTTYSQDQTRHIKVCRVCCADSCISLPQWWNHHFIIISLVFNR